MAFRPEYEKALMRQILPTPDEFQKLINTSEPITKNYRQFTSRVILFHVEHEPIALKNFPDLTNKSPGTRPGLGELKQEKEECRRATNLAFVRINNPN